MTSRTNKSRHYHIYKLHIEYCKRLGNPCWNPTTLDGETAISKFIFGGEILEYKALFFIMYSSSTLNTNKISNKGKKRENYKQLPTTLLEVNSSHPHSTHILKKKTQNNIKMKFFITKYQDSWQKMPLITTRKFQFMIESLYSTQSNKKINFY